MKKGHVICLIVSIFILLASCSYQAYQPHKEDISLTFQIPQYLKGEPSGSGRFIHPDANRINLIIKDGERTVVNQTKTIEGEDSVTFILENIPSAKLLGLEARVYNENNKLVGSRTTTIGPISVETRINIGILPNEDDVIPMVEIDGGVYQIGSEIPENSDVYIFKIPELNKGVYRLVSYDPEDYQLFLYDSKGYTQGTPTYVDPEDPEDLEIYHFFGNTKKEDMYLVALGAEEEPPNFSIQAHNGSVVVVGPSSHENEFGEILKEYTQIDFGGLSIGEKYGNPKSIELMFSIYNPYNMPISISNFDINYGELESGDVKDYLSIAIDEIDMESTDPLRRIKITLEAIGTGRSLGVEPQVTINFDSVDPYTLKFTGSISSE